MKNTKFFQVAIFTVIMSMSTSAYALVIGGSDLLSTSNVTQLESWLGQGQLDLTNIFDKTSSDTSTDFHNAVDGQGPTFSIIEVLGDANGLFSESIIIGGYNPQSWDSTTGYRLTNDLAARTAFIFNLTSNIMQAQRLDNQGIAQTVNVTASGPSFGQGSDIWVNNTLGSGYTYAYSYGSCNGYACSITGLPQTSAGQLQFGQIEVFSISPSDVPEPASILLFGFGLIGLVGIVRRKTHL